MVAAFPITKAACEKADFEHSLCYRKNTYIASCLLLKRLFYSPILQAQIYTRNFGYAKMLWSAALCWNYLLHLKFAVAATKRLWIQSVICAGLIIVENENWVLLEWLTIQLTFAANPGRSLDWEVSSTFPAISRLPIPVLDWTVSFIASCRKQRHRKLRWALINCNKNFIAWLSSFWESSW